MKQDDSFVDHRANYSKSIKDLPKRPQKSNVGSIGQEINLCTNHYKIDVDAKLIVFVYGMNILQAQTQDSESYEEFPRDNRRDRSTIFKNIAKQLEKLLGKYYQSGLNIWAFKKIDPASGSLITSLGTKKILFKLEAPKEYSYSDLMNNDELSQAFRQVFGVITKTYLKELDYVENGKDIKYFKLADQNKNTLKNNDMLKVWHGYKTSVQVLDKTPMLLIDFSVRVLRNETALKRLGEYEKLNYTKKDIDEEMQEHSVMSNYGNQQIYKVHKVDYTRNPLSKFKQTNDKEVTYVQYYQEKYSIVIKNKTQPLIVHNKNIYVNEVLDGVQKRKRVVQEICLIPELVNMTGIRDDEKANRNLMKDLAEYTKLEPSKRMQVIDALRIPLSKKFEGDGYQLNKLKNFKGILLKAPIIFLGGKKSMVPKDGNFMIRDPIYQPTEIKNWIMIYCKRGNRDDEDVDEFIDTLIKAAATFGIKIAKPFFLNVSTLNYQDWEKEIDKELEHGNVTMILTWIPENQKGKLYTPLKKLCYKHLGIPHQNCLSNKFINSKNKLSHASKIAMQMNAKLGKSLWYVEPVKGIPKKTMIIGVDVYHKLVQKKKSCAGFVASLDENFSNFYCNTVIQKMGVELMEGIAGQVQQAIQEYLRVNKYLPELIIIYRDGVGESQIVDVMNVEVESIKALFSLIDKDYKPQFVEVIINKKINQRFFSETQSGVYNPQSGTLVCDRVVHNYFEFFIVPQNVTQGTATPTSFKVIENSSNLSAESIYQLTFFQCHNYANWTGAVRVPAPTMYAHKLAYLVGDTFQDEIHKDLKRTLCFL